MITFPLDSFEAFERQVHKIRGEIAARRRHEYQIHVEPLFRGQSDASWSLRTTLERRTTEKYSFSHYNGLLLAAGCQVESFTDRVWNLEEGLSFTESHIPRPPNYNFMVYARHHGFPAPLMDWSRSEYVALYFAFCDAEISEEKQVAVFIYIDTMTGAKSGFVGAPQISRLGPYVSTHKRHFAQQAEYTIAAYRHKETSQWIYCPHDHAFAAASTEQQDILFKITLPSNMKFDVLQRLHRMNINAFTLFGTEEALMAEMAYKEIDLRNKTN